jgi:hypothetical protein
LLRGNDVSLEAIEKTHDIAGKETGSTPLNQHGRQRVVTNVVTAE